MNTTELASLRQLSAQIKSAIGDATAIVAEVDGSKTKALVGESLGDLWRASEILEAKLLLLGK
jgi:hypothetical protein